MSTTLPITSDLFLAGSWQPGSGARVATLNPTNGELITELAGATADDVDTAVAAARAALTRAWGAILPSQKGVLLFRLADLVERDARTMAELEALDMGVPVGQAAGLFVPNLIATLRYYAGWADKINGETLSPDGYLGSPTHTYTRREPVGVIAAIVPWNAPSMILGWKLAPALASGNVVIVKPAEDASLSILHLAKLVEEAGFPAGIVQVLTGTGSVTGEALVAHPGVDKVSFTGSTAVGRGILRRSADSFTRTTLELGGKSPQIVFADANLGAAVEGVAMGLLANQGQTCACGSRILVHRSRMDDLLDGLRGAVEAQVLGDPLDAGTTMGPLVNAKQQARVRGYIAAGTAEGATLVAGGRPVDGPGFFVSPTVFAGSNDLRIAREEIFGPVGIVVPFDDDAEAVTLANNTEYGLAATVWTTDVARAHRVSAALQVGAVGVNCWSPLAPQSPWGGRKASGVGRELGYEGIVANTEVKTVTVLL